MLRKEVDIDGLKHCCKKSVIEGPRREVHPGREKGICMKSAWRQWQGKVEGEHTGRQAPELEKQTQAPDSH